MIDTNLILVEYMWSEKIQKSQNMRKHKQMLLIGEFFGFEMHTASELRRYHGQVSATIKLGGKFINITRNKAKFEIDNYTVGRKVDRVLLRTREEQNGKNHNAILLLFHDSNGIVALTYSCQKHWWEARVRFPVSAGEFHTSLSKHSKLWKIIFCRGGPPSVDKEEHALLFLVLCPSEFFFEGLSLLRLSFDPKIPEGGAEGLDRITLRPTSDQE